MRKFWRVILVAVIAATIFSFNVKRQQAENQLPLSAGKIEQIELDSNGFGWTRTTEKLWQTNDGGENWREITPPKAAEQRLSGVSFHGNSGFVILSNVEIATFEIACTVDGGDSWAKQNLNLPTEILSEAGFDRVLLEFSDTEKGFLVVRLVSSSNFTRAALFSTNNGGSNWQLEQNFIERGEFPLEALTTAALREQQTATAKINGKDFEFQNETGGEFSFDAPLLADENVTAIDISNSDNGWILVEKGHCQNFKSDCEQSARILATYDGGANWREITPDAAKQSIKIPNLRSENQNALPPNGSTKISMNRGFDKCTAAPVAQMQTWWNESPFHDSNIYISGRNRGCTQPQLNAAWVNQVSAQGWGLIPTIVGYQSSCSVCTSCQKHSSDAATAETQGRGEADIAIADAGNLGLTQGTILYYDMERYDDLSGTGACSTPTKAFLKGWTDRLHELGYVSGTYGSPTNAIGDWINIPAASRMDAVWMARWNNNGSVWGAAVAPLTDGYWTNHQRIHQFQAPFNATYGGITFNIDGNISDAPVAGVRPPKNKPADFDGDGKSDVSVFRPETGAWFWLNSSNSTFGAIQFGAAEDRIVPGDYDGDGKTDIAVYRPSSGIWYQYSYNPARPAAGVIRARQFGASGDVPVPADYDGDGNTDIAVFRSGSWFISNSLDPTNPNLRVESFGIAGDLPTTGDFDGDGRADLGVFRPSSGSWFVQRSTAGFYAVQFGANGDHPAQGDFDGDGKTDVAVFRPTTGVWYLLQSTNGFSATQFGAVSDQPAPGDFDGDNKFDIAVFRPASGAWYIQQSQAGFYATQFGANGDKPIPTGYIP